MPMADAVKFLKQAAKEEELRDSLYHFQTRKDRMDHLADLGYRFNPAEMEQAFYYLKVESPTKENADLVEDLFMWWRIVDQD